MTTCDKTGDKKANKYLHTWLDCLSGRDGPFLLNVFFFSVFEHDFNYEYGTSGKKRPHKVFGKNFLSLISADKEDLSRKEKKISLKKFLEKEREKSEMIWALSHKIMLF